MHKTAYRFLERDGLSREDTIIFLAKVQYVFVIQRLLDFFDESSHRGVTDYYVKTQPVQEQQK